VDTIYAKYLLLYFNTPIHHDPIACDRKNFEIAGALERYVSTIDAGRDEEEFVDLFWALDLARGAPLE
jgi:hypothetical protein